MLAGCPLSVGAGVGESHYSRLSTGSFSKAEMAASMAVPLRFEKVIFTLQSGSRDGRVGWSVGPPL